MMPASMMAVGIDAIVHLRINRAIDSIGILMSCTERLDGMSPARASVVLLMRGSPQWGHASARGLIRPPHSRHNVGFLAAESSGTAMRRIGMALSVTFA